MARLPQVGGDNDNWGQVLNDYLQQSHKGDGTLKDAIIDTGRLQDGSVTTVKLANSAVTIPKINATGTASGSTYLRGDGMWATPSGGGGTVTISDLPSGSMLYVRYNTGTSSWPSRPTSRTDIMVHWVGSDDSDPPAGALAGVDIWDWTTS